MKPQDLAKVWDAPDNSKLTPKQFSLRLPIHVSAKITALCEIYPRKSKTEIIGDLLAVALEQFENGLCEVGGYDQDTEEPLYIETAQSRRFSKLTREYLEGLELELLAKESKK